MTNKPSLVVLAAGLGSRYGSLKQIDKLGPNGETIIDYAIYDALNVGFEKLVFVIRKSFEQEFKEIFEKKLPENVQSEYVFQELDMLPEGFCVPTGREKPWGTAHAVMTVGDVIDEPFAIINADDFYGRKSLSCIFNYLSQIDNKVLDACLVGFMLENTLTDHGRVSRGICKVSEQQILNEITEKTHIFKGENGGIFYTEDGSNFALTGKEIVSMNLIGFTPLVFPLIRKLFRHFLNQNAINKDLKAEFFIPSVLEEVRRSGVKVPVLETSEQWFGVTYKEDKENVANKIQDLVREGRYPEKLWN